MRARTQESRRGEEEPGGGLPRDGSRGRGKRAARGGPAQEPPDQDPEGRPEDQGHVSGKVVRRSLRSPEFVLQYQLDLLGKRAADRSTRNVVKEKRGCECDV